MNVNRLDDKEYKIQTLKLALFLGELLIKNGAETYRVEDSVLRICKSRGYTHINCFTTPTVIILSDDKFDGLCFMKTIDIRGINLTKLSLLNGFSRDFVNKIDPDMNAEIEELHRIDKLKGYSPKVIYISTGFASAIFAAMIGGNQLNNFILTIFTSMLSAYIYDKIVKYSNIIIFANLISSIVITSSGFILNSLGLIHSPTTLIVGSIMPLLPGVAFVKSLRDLISGNLVSGTARFFEVIMILIAIASGVALVLGIGGIK